jgi:MFS transporter, UMF1 family
MERRVERTGPAAGGASGGGHADASPLAPKAQKRTGPLGLVSWALYDWANSPYTTLIITFVFPAYFLTAIVGDAARGQTLWGYALGISGLAVALLAPVGGAIADAGGRRKPWLFAFTWLCAAMAALLWFATPGPESIGFALVCIFFGIIGYELGVVFNNAMLPDIAPPGRLGRLSGWAWGLGYVGGLTALTLALVLWVQTETPLFGLDQDMAEHVRILGPFIGLWLVIFSVPLLLFTPDRTTRWVPIVSAVRRGMTDLRGMIRKLPQERNLLLYLIAHMVYADGLVTLFAFGGLYASGEFDMSLAEVLQFAIVLNIAAGIGAFGFGWVDDWLGSRRTVIIALSGLLVASAGAVLAPTVAWLWVAGIVIGIFVGPAQAASRSLMARLSPTDKAAEYFGLYALSGKATAFVGPALVGMVTQVTGSQRAGMATILLFLGAGLVLLMRVREHPAG